MKLKTILNISSFLTASVLLTGCYRDVDLDRYKEQNGEHMLAINSIINPDSTIAVAATRTYFFQDEHSRRSYVEGLDIRLSVNGESRGLLTYNPESRLYECDVKPDELDRVELHTVYGDCIVSTSDVVPEKVHIESVEVSRQGPMPIYWENDYILTYRITFTDPVGVDNYYFLQYDNTDFRHGVGMGERDFTYEFVFQQLARVVNANIPGWEPYSPYGLPFSDYGIDGDTHTLTVKEIVQGGGGVDLTRYSVMERRFKLFSISKDYYDYLLSVLYNDTSSDGLHGGMIDLGLAEPMKYFSNISGGVGIFAAYALDQTDVDVMAVTGRFPK